MIPTTGRRRWLFLGVLIEEISEPGSPVTVAEAILPEGASPPAHVHVGLDDSSYVLEGRIVVRCGDEVWAARPGSWLQFPAGVPHTFRVIGGPARVLLVHADASFLDAVRQLGRPAVDADPPHTGPGPTIEELDRALADHGIKTVGPPMGQEEAELLLLECAASATAHPGGPITCPPTRG